MKRDFRLCLRLCRDESPWQEITKFFFGGWPDFGGVFWGVANAFSERQGGFGARKTPRGVQNAPFSCDYGPDFPRQWATTAPVLPRKTLDSATRLWTGVDGIAVFLRSLAWDLRAGGGRVVSTQRTQRTAEHWGTRLRPGGTTPWQALDLSRRAVPLQGRKMKRQCVWRRPDFARPRIWPGFRRTP